MPTSYAGVPTATQAPSVPPTPGVVPTVSIPNDGEAENAASVAQMVKVLADFNAWLMSPRAKASAWAEPIALWRNAALKRGFGIDHLGFPAGRLNHWRECFNAGAVQDSTIGVSGLSTLTVADGQWRLDVSRASTGAEVGRVAFVDPTAGWPSSRRCQIDTSEDGTSYSSLLHKACAYFATDMSFAMEWDAVVNNGTGREVVMGFNEPLVVSGGGAIAQFRAVNGGNYFAETYAAGTPTTTDTGVAMNATTRRFRIEYHAANMDDAGAEKVMYFVDGVLKASHTTNLPSGAASPLARPWFVQINNGGAAIGARTLWITPITFSANLWNDAF